MISVIVPRWWYHLHIATLGKVVIFYGITGFQRRCFLITISHLNSHLDNNQMHKIKKKHVLSYVGLLFFWLSLLGVIEQ